MITKNEIEYCRPEQKELQAKVEFWRTAARSGFADGAWAAREINPRFRTISTEDGGRKQVDDAPYLQSDKWLVRNDYEGAKSFTRRLKVAKDFGYSEKIIRSYLSYFSRSKISCEIGKYAQYFYGDPFSANIDGSGASVEDFAEMLAGELLTVGQVYVCTDFAEGGLYPYSYTIPAECVMDWIEANGSFSMIKWRSREDVRNGFTVDCVNVIYLWTNEIFYKFVEISDGKYQQIETPNRLGSVPIHYAGIGKGEWSLINTPARFQLDMMNLDSEIRNILSRQAINILHMAQHIWDGMGVLTADSVLVYDDNYNGLAPGFIAYPASGLDGHFQYIDRLRDWVHDLANIRTRSSVQQSGISKQWDFFDTEAILSTIAEKVEKLLIKCGQDWGNYFGIKPEVEIKIGRDFDIKNLQEEIKTIMDLMVIGVGQTAEADLKRRARDLVLKYDGEKLDQSNAEIDGVFEPDDEADAAIPEEIGVDNEE